MKKNFIFSLTLLAGALITTGCNQPNPSPNEVITESTPPAPSIEKEEITLCYYDIAEMKLMRSTIEMGNPSPEKALQLLTKEIPETGSLSRLPSEMIIDKVEINPETHTAEVYATLDENLMGNYSSSAWSESMTYAIVYTLIENKSFDIEKVILGENFAGLYGLSGDVSLKLEKGEIVSE